MVVEYGIGINMSKIPERNTAFIDYIREDKSKYQTATAAGYYDPDDDFLVGESGGFLMNISFTFANTYLLSEVSKLYSDKTRKYVDYEVDSPEYIQFLLREELRRKSGYTAPCKRLKDGSIVDLRITGEHYNFLNYGRIMMLDDDSVTAGASGDKIKSFPKNIDAQYWYFKIKEFIKNNAFNLVVGKSRRMGASWIEAIDSANTLNLYRERTIIHGAYIDKYITKGDSITNMAKSQLDFYEECTPFHRGAEGVGLLKKDIYELILGYRDAGGNNSGCLSKLLSLSFSDDPSKAVGKDAIKIKFDELNNFPNLDKVMGVTEPTTGTGAYKTGIIIGFGTGGATEGDWIHFERWFYNPDIYNAMPFENVWDKNARHLICGFYKPYWWGLEGEVNEKLFRGLDDEIAIKYKHLLNKKAIDKDGNSDWEIAISISELQRIAKEKNSNVAQFKTYCSQYSNCPAESFSSGASNIFSSVELTDHKDYLKHNTSARFYRDGQLVANRDGSIVFKSNELLKSEGHPIHDFVTKVPFSQNDDNTGCCREFFPPFKDAAGNVYENEVVIVYDPVGVDKKKDEITDKHSLASMEVWLPAGSRAGNVADLLLMSWCGRNDSMEEDDRIILNAALYYGVVKGRVLPETARGTCVANFRKWHKLNLLMTNPTSVLDDAIADKESSDYGMRMGDTLTKLNGIKYSKDLLYMPFSQDDAGKVKYLLHYIYDLPLIEEFTKFNILGNFDRISTFLLYAYARKALSTRNMLDIVTIDNNDIPNDVIDYLRNYYDKL